MWNWKRGKQHKPSGNQARRGMPEEQPRAKPPGSLTSQQNRIISLGESGRYRTALDEILRGLRQNPDDSFLLKAATVIAGASRTANLAATEPATLIQRSSALLAPIATECSSCGQTWYSKHWTHSPNDRVTILRPIGLQCQKCRYTLCRNCLASTGLSHGRIDEPELITGPCPELGHGLLGTPVLATGRSDVATIPPDRIEAVIVTRDGPVLPAMNEALDVVTMFVPLIADDAPLIHIRPSKPGLMTEKSGREELAVTRVHDLEREGILTPGAWNRSERIFAKVPDASASKYLMTVIGKAEVSTRGDMKASAPPSVIIDGLITAAEGLPVAHEDDIQYNYDFAGPKWGAREILILTSDELRRRLETVCAADVANGFTIINTSISSEGSQNNALPYAQLNMISDTLRSGRPYRITKRKDGRFAVYGHAALYNA